MDDKWNDDLEATRVSDIEKLREELTQRSDRDRVPPARRAFALHAIGDACQDVGPTPLSGDAIGPTSERRYCRVLCRQRGSGQAEQRHQDQAAVKHLSASSGP